MHVRDDERLAQHLDHRDRRADARLEAQLHARVRRGGEELRPAPRDELLVRRDDVLAAAQAARARTRRPARRRPSPRRRPRSTGRRATSAMSVVSTPSSGGNSRSLSRSRTSALTTRSRWPVARSMSSACSFSSRLTAEPTVPYPSSATGTSTDAMRLRDFAPAEPAQALADLLDLGLARASRAPRRGSARPCPSRRSTPSRTTRPGSR